MTTDERGWAADEVRAAERPLLEAGVPLMRMAARALAAEVRAMRPTSLLVLAGSGDNGGDAMFAAAELAAEGVPVAVWQVGSRVHDEALRAAMDAGARRVPAYSGEDVVLDGILGIGARPPLRDPARSAVASLLAADPRPRIVAVDLPSGVPDSVTDHIPLVGAEGYQAMTNQVDRLSRELPRGGAAAESG